jgi:hypothetical protein
MCPKPAAEDPRVAKCLAATRESKAIEFKEQFVPTDARQSLEILKDIVAIANSGGGALAIGVTNAGKGCQSDVKPVFEYDHAKYCDVIRKYTGQHFADFEVIEAKKDGHTIAVFLINAPDYPLVFEKPGTYAVDKNRQETTFSRGTVYFRHGAKSEAGTTEDLRRFIEKRVREMQQQLVKGMRRVSEAPRGSELLVAPRGSVVTDHGNALAVRITSDKDARDAIQIDKNILFPYRRRELAERLKKELDKSLSPNTYDLQAINHIYDIAEDEYLSWKPQFSSRQYGEAFVAWIVDKISKNKDFLAETRRKFREKKRSKE